MSAPGSGRRLILLSLFACLGDAARASLGSIHGPVHGWICGNCHPAAFFVNALPIFAWVVLIGGSLHLRLRRRDIPGAEMDTGPLLLGALMGLALATPLAFCGACGAIEIDDFSDSTSWTLEYRLKCLADEGFHMAIVNLVLVWPVLYFFTLDPVLFVLHRSPAPPSAEDRA
ncbi:MAG: hypothetical protein HY720_04425 [Planctomycetes bacterium]|nr:hypothetical protein [Planctomycetota bacterium]